MRVGNFEIDVVDAIDDGRPCSHVRRNAVHAAIVLTFIVLAMCRDNDPTLIPASVTTVGASYAEMQFNRGITDLSVLKDTETGEVVVAFTWDERRTAYDYHVASGLLVRLFDRNGAYVTASVADGPMSQYFDRDGRFMAKVVVAEHQLSVVRYAEVGFRYPRRF
jgi:hypothetical protein